MPKRAVERLTARTRLLGRVKLARCFASRLGIGHRLRLLHRQQDARKHHPKQSSAVDVVLGADAPVMSLDDRAYAEHLTEYMPSAEDKKLLLEIIGNEKKWIAEKTGARDPLASIGEVRKSAINL